MKKIILSLTIVLAGLSAVQAQTSNATTDAVKAVNPKAADIKFNSLEIDYGTIEHNADGNREF